MLRRLNRSGLLWPTLLTVPALAVLVGLGTWQWERMAWKNALIARLQAAAKSRPADYGTIALSALPRDEAGSHLPVEVRGRFDHAREIYVFWAGTKTPGYLVLTPFQPLKGKPILINRGFVPEAKRNPATRPQGQIAGETVVRGLLVRRGGNASTFTPAPDVSRRVWYDIVPEEMAEKLNLNIVRNFTIDADGAPNPGGLPRGRAIAERVSQIPNRHLEYALTWWGLALTLIGVYAAFARGRLKGTADEGE
ncbi:MAG: SURF1 family protein [Hyphomicrobiaceae bacterium]|nr:SURF1 family protein [Hyphomicrobiaceae bacterium]